MIHPDYSEGSVLLIDKPVGWTSFDVVNKIKYTLKVKCGHAGTLDPLATGLLIVCTGKMTKKINEYQGMEKEYAGVIMLGYTTPSYDLETEPVSSGSTKDLDIEKIREEALKLTGNIKQIPPFHSAKYVNGKRAYLLARQGEENVLPANDVFVKEFEITGFSESEVHFRVVCSKGTYIRSLAHDLGQLLGCGGYLKSLVRTRIGDFRLEGAHELKSFLEDFKNQRNKAD